MNINSHIGDGVLPVQVIRTASRQHFAEKDTLVYDEETKQLRVGCGYDNEMESISSVKTVESFGVLPTEGRMDTMYFCLDTGYAYVWNPETSAYVPMLMALQKEVSLKANKVYIDNELAKKASVEYVNNKLGEKTDKAYVDGLMASKANKAYVDELLVGVANKKNVEDALESKASKVYVDTKLNLKANEKYVDIELGKKADKTSVDELAENKADRIYVDEQLDDKANKKYVDNALNTKADRAALDKKVDKSYVNAQIQPKADKSYVDNKLEAKADKTYVDEKISAKVDRSYVNEQVEALATKAYVNNNLAAKADKVYVDSSIQVKADKSYVDDALEKKAGISYVDEKATPKAEVEDATIQAGQIVKTDSSGGLVANDLLKIVHVAGTPAEVAKIAAAPINMAEAFANWQRVSCDSKGQEQNSEKQEKARASYYYNEDTKSIVSTDGSDTFSGFLSADKFAPDYKIKYSFEGRDDSGLFFIAGFMTDKSDKFHTLSVLNTNNKLAICYDAYDMLAENISLSGGLILKSMDTPGACVCEVQKSATEIIVKAADSDEPGLTFTLPSTKPESWTQEQYDNIRYMMTGMSNVGFGTQAGTCSFAVLEQEGAVTAVSIYDVTEGKKLTYFNGKKLSEEVDASVAMPGSFLYSAVTQKLFYAKDKNTVVPILLS